MGNVGKTGRKRRWRSKETALRSGGVHLSGFFSNNMHWTLLCAGLWKIYQRWGGDREGFHPENTLTSGVDVCLIDHVNLDQMFLKYLQN